MLLFFFFLNEQLLGFLCTRTVRVEEQHLATAKQANELQAASPTRGLRGYLARACRLALINSIVVATRHTQTPIKACIWGKKPHNKNKTLIGSSSSSSSKKGQIVKFSERCGHGKCFHILQIHPATYTSPCTHRTHTQARPGVRTTCSSLFFL